MGAGQTILQLRCPRSAPSWWCSAESRGMAPSAFFGLFFCPKNPDFCPKIRFFIWDRVFLAQGRAYPSAWGPLWHLRIYCATFRFRVTPVFVRGPVRRAKKSSPTPLWGHRLPVTVLALSARGLDNLRKFLGGLNALCTLKNLCEGETFFILPVLIQVWSSI